MTAVLAAPPDTGLLATRRGKLIVTVLAAIGFLDFIDSSIVNVALPDIRTDLDFSVHNLQWVVSGYLLTYGGFMLLGGRLADLLGRRRVLVAGTVVFAVSSMAAGLAQNEGLLIGGRLAQGVGAAFMVPAALSLLTTSFVGAERHKVLAVWGGVAGLGSAIGVLGGGFFTQGPGWRWIFFVNPPISVIAIVAVVAMFPADRRAARVRDLDVPGALLATGGMLLLVFALVRAPERGWGATSTILEFAGAALVLGLFVALESVVARPLVPLEIFRVRGLAAADITAFIGVGGFGTMFFFLTVYMQNVLGYSPIRTGLAYLPATFVVGVAVAIASVAIGRIGTRPVIVAGALITALGLFLLSGIDAGGSYVGGLLPGLSLVAFGIGGVFVGATTAANHGVPPNLAGLAAALVNSSQQVGGALGLAVLTALATTRTNDLLAGGTVVPIALTEGFRRALAIAGVLLVAAAMAALRTVNVRAENQPLAH